MNATSNPVLVVGGSGRTGQRVVERLAGSGQAVRVLSRHPTPSGGGAHRPGVEIVAGDLAAVHPDVLDGITAVVVTVEPPTDGAAADKVMHRGVADLAAHADATATPVILVSQIYITRPDAYPAMGAVIAARGRGEQALRASGAPYAIVRPGWLTDDPASGVRCEQGDTGAGTTSRDTVADACVHLLAAPQLLGRTFELFDAPAGLIPDWPAMLMALTPDREAS